MCDTCGCNVTPGNRHLVTGDGKLATTESGREAVSVLEGLLSENDHQAGHNREHFDRHGVLAINLMSSPGAGKTALLEATIDALSDRYSIGVIEGDLETENDAERIRARGVPASMPTWSTTPCTRCGSRISTSCSSRTWATWSALPASISASI